MIFSENEEREMMVYNSKQQKLMGKNNKYVETIFMLLSMTIVILICMGHINENTSIKIWPDEVGYWQNASILLEEDWSGTTYVYYGYGLGFLLAPIMLLFENSDIRMQAAVVLQTMILCSSIVAIYLIINEMNLKLREIEKGIIGIFPVLYSAYLFFTQFTLAETVLVSCMWWWLYAILIFIKKRRIISGFFVMAIPFYMYMVHQRTLPYIIIGGVIISVACMFDFKNGRKKALLIWLIFVTVGIALYFAVKSYDGFYVSKIFSEKTVKTGNTVAGRVNSVKQLLFSMKGWLAIIQSMCGKIYYSIVATFGLTFFGSAVAILSFRNLIIKQTSNYIKDILYVIVFINFFVALTISCVAMYGGYETRGDKLMYGRYSEFAYGAVLLIGIIELFQNNISKISKERIILSGCILTVLLCLICTALTYNDASMSVFWISCSGLGDLLCLSEKTGISNQSIILIAGIRCILFMLILLVIIERERSHNILLNTWVIMVALLWIYIANISWTENVMDWYDESKISQSDIAEEIQNESLVGILDVDYPGSFQFLLPDTYFKQLNSIQDLSDDYEGLYIITNKESKNATEILKNFTIIKINSQYILWEYN